MDIRLLGPVAMVGSGRVAEVGPPQRCAVLAALAVDAGRQVSAETLIDRVWGENPPERARRALHAHLTRIRRMLEQAGDEPVAVLRRAGGYVLGLDPGRVDAHRFRQLCDLAREPGRTAVDRAAVLRAALDLWHGEPLAGVAGDWAACTRQAWRQQYLDAALGWGRAQVRDNPAAVVAPLSDLVGANPFLEPLVAVLMRALYLTGDAARALELYTSTRQRLVAELGAEPGPELRRVHQGILRGDLGTHDACDPAAPQAASARPAAGQAVAGHRVAGQAAGHTVAGQAAGHPAAVVPAQLPRDTRLFTGRGQELARLDAELPDPPGPATETAVVVLSGTAGVGKTTLAVHWAHRVRDRFRDGQLYVNLRGFDPGGQAMAAGDALRGFLEAIGVTPDRMPASPDGQAALYRSLLAGRRMLVLLDNARTAEQVRPLLPGAPGCLVLVTSRSNLSGLVAADGAQLVALKLLAPAEARQLLVRRIGADRVAEEPQAVENIIDRCARLPLALAIVAARAAVHPHFSLALLAKELSESADRLDALDGEDASTDVRAVFSWSYQALGPDTARLFRMLGQHPGPDFTLPAAASLAGLPPATVRPVLTELTRANLITEHVPGRYTCHDLLRLYAAEQGAAADSEPQRHEATRRMLDHYLHTAHAADTLVGLGALRDPMSLDPPHPGVTPQAVADRDQALTWFAAEHQVLLASIENAAATGFDAHACRLAWTLYGFHSRGGHWHDMLAAQTTAVAAARRLGDSAADHTTLAVLAHDARSLARARLGDRDGADADIEQALQLSRRAGDTLGEADTHLYAAAVCILAGLRYAECLDHGRQALDLHRTIDHKRGYAEALNGVGWSLAALGEYEQALPYCRQSLVVAQDVDNDEVVASTWDSLGYVYQRTGDHARAITCYQQSIGHMRAAGNRFCEGHGYLALGTCHEATGDLDAAGAAWQHAEAIFIEFGHPETAAKARAKLQQHGWSNHPEQARVHVAWSAPQNGPDAPAREP